MDKVRIAAIQYDIKSGEKENNLDKAIQLIKKAVEDKADIIAFPEYFLTGFPITKKNVREWAEPIPGPLTDKLSEIAIQNQVYILGSLLEEENGEYYATCPLIGPDGRITGKHRKVNFWMMYPCDERGAGLKPGNDFTVLNTDLLKMGILLGDDFVTPESSRICALKGADVTFYLTGVEYSWRENVLNISRAYAFANMMYIIMVNRTGSFDHISFFGECIVVNPLGEMISTAGSSYETLNPENYVIGTIDLEKLISLRKQPWNPLKNRKPETYSLITDIEMLK